jgi:uncharacterized protein (DUF2141 family)
MKMNIFSGMLAIFILGMILVFSGCSSKSNNETGGPGLSGKIKGTATLPAGAPGNISKAKANLYNNPPISGGHSPDKSVSVSGTRDSVTFSFTGLAAGTYYIEVWKDSVATGTTWEIGDLVGWYGSGTVDYPVWMPVTVNTSLTSNISVTMHSMSNDIHGTLSGVNDYSNSKVSIYTDLTNWQNNIPEQYVMTAGSGTSVTYSIKKIPPGTYYLDVWKDTDNSGSWSSGDYIGWYGTGGIPSIELTPIQITEFSSVQADVSMIVLQK